MAWLFKDIILVLGLVVMATITIVGAIGLVFDIQEIRTSVAIWGLSWFEFIAIIFALAFWVVVQKVIRRLNKYEKAKPLLTAFPVSFPTSGLSIVTGDELSTPQKGYATIGVINKGGLLKDCVATVSSMAIVSVGKKRINISHISSVLPQTATWANGETSITIPNDGVARMLNLAYIDQSKDGWQLATKDDVRRVNYGNGWYKIDVVISSESQQIERLVSSVALGYEKREPPAQPAGLNIWPWDTWYKSRQNQMRQASRREGSQT